MPPDAASDSQRPEAAHERLTVSYRLRCAEGEDPMEKAREIALEQTVELPAECVREDILAHVVGRVERLHEGGDGSHVAVISYDRHSVEGDVPALLNLLFGNISMQEGIRVNHVDWPDGLLRGVPGPRYGIDGLRAMCGVPRRALLCAALKPLGFTAQELALRCHELAMGGVDVIKDDHNIADQRVAPFLDRVERCVAAVARANRATGGRTLYFPNVTGRAADLHERVERASKAGCQGVLVSPLVVGADEVRLMAETAGVAILGHPALAGAFFGADHGIAPELLLGDLYRMMGCDGVIFPHAGGRFPWSLETCDALAERLRAPLGRLRPAMPVPGGGVDTARVPEHIGRYGVDVMFLIGGSFYGKPDLRAGVRALLSVMKEESERSLVRNPQ